jgi:hypothetical protein
MSRQATFPFGGCSNLAALLIAGAAASSMLGDLLDTLAI